MGLKAGLIFPFPEKIDRLKGSRERVREKVREGHRKIETDRRRDCVLFFNIVCYRL